MGKELKKGRPPPGGKQFFKKVVRGMEQRSSCVHFDKCVDLDELLKKMKACEQIKCGECKEGLHTEKRRSEGKVNSFSFAAAKKAIWLCLECGHYICGGVGLPTGAQSHVMRHVRLTRHRLVIQCENTRLRWCFACQSLLSFEKEENGEKIDLLTEAVKLIKERSSNTYSGGTEVEPSSSSSISGGLEARKGYAVRGLVNLGNTCFFNSVLQNLLSLDQLRDHMLKEEDPCCDGPLVSSLKKLFTEATSVPGLFNRVINPSALFGSVCSKAPQFWGYQQHDSHELLRCLLDGLSIEESSLRKKLDVADGSDDDSEKPTLVDSVFGGELSSTISCQECGHYSKVYEPFLDLSLPVPSKKPPPRKQQTFTQEEVFKSVEDSKHSSEPLSTMTLDNEQIPEIAITQKDMEEVDSFWWEAFRIEVSHNETDLVSQGDVSDTAPLLQAEVADQTFVGSEKPDKEEDPLASSEVSAEISEAQVWGYPGLGQSSSSANPFADEEIPLLVSDSQVLYKEDKTVAEDKVEASLSDVSGQPEKTVDCDDFFSWRFNDPDFSCNDKPVKESEGEAPSSLVSGHHEQKIDSADHYHSFFDQRSFFRPPTKAKASEAGFSSNSDAEVIDDSDSPVSVESCLALFTNPEILSEDNAWHCENCSKNLKLQRLREKRGRFCYGFRDDIFNQSFFDLINLETMYDDDESVDSEEVIVRSPANKRVLVNKAPPVLTIHLKRFSQDARGRLSKLSGHVAFKEFIDLGLYMDMDSRGAEEDQPVYMLAGIVEHSGTMRRGHYVAYIRGEPDEKRGSSIWYRASDSFVRQVSFEEVLRSEAYLLFYQRI